VIIFQALYCDDPLNTLEYVIDIVPYLEFASFYESIYLLIETHTAVKCYQRRHNWYIFEFPDN